MKTKQKIPVVIKHRREIPLKSEMEENTLYYMSSIEYVSHKCLCGCGAMITLPVSQGGWTFDYTNDKATMTPSILNDGCKAHYIITNGIANIV